MSPAPDTAGSPNYVDDLFDYDVGLDGILQEINTNSTSSNGPKQSAPLDNSGVVLGLDEEVKVTKKRQPVAKLDENRLLSQSGIPKLRRSVKKNLRFKGKGHEFSDLARLLNFYQLWLDDLFPKAKFADGLAMIEKLGHSKRLQTMRRAWIDEEKPKTEDEDVLDPLQTGAIDIQIASNETSMADNRQSTFDRPMLDGATCRQPDDMDGDLFMPDDNNQRRTNTTCAVPLEDDALDELDALLGVREDEAGATKGSSAGAKLRDINQRLINGDDSAPLNDDDSDELDALLREQENEPGFGKGASTDTKPDHDSQQRMADIDRVPLDELLREHEDKHGAGNPVSAGATQGVLETYSHADDSEAIEGLDVSSEMANR
ncbi:replication fork protection component Swi3-domain-containing protein [Aspergillus egyptiacus]|nr:replication fork protection component Swi3-domain-containing protein [Aspergillus egyptiacus]